MDLAPQRHCPKNSGFIDEALGGVGASWVAVSPEHIYMLQQPERFGVPIWALWLRLPIQAGLLWLIWWSTAEPKRR